MEDTYSSQPGLVKRIPPDYIYTQPYTGEEIIGEQHPLTTNGQSNAGVKSLTSFDHGTPRDNLSQASSTTGIRIRTVSNYHDEATYTRPAKVEKRENILWIWRFELLLLFVGTGLFVAICLILDGYSDQEIPEWNMMGLTLNTLISILATFFRAAIAVVTFEVLAQRKWNWLCQDVFRPLRDVELFDSASRGVFGCLRLLPVIALQEPMAFCAIAVTILSLGIGSFTQQSIQTYQCLREVYSHSSASTIAMANTIETGDFISPFDDGYLNVKMKIAMQDATLSPNDVSSLFNCPSGNCTFTTYSDYPDKSNLVSHASLGICSKCIDVYDLVERTNTSEPGFPLNYSLPIDVEFEEKSMELILGYDESITRNTYINVATLQDLSWTEPVATSDFLNRARWSIENITFLGISEDRCKVLQDQKTTCPNTCSADSREDGTCFGDSRTVNGRPTDYAAASCIMYPCIRYYRAEFKNSIPKEEVVREVPLRKQSFVQPDNSLWSAADSDSDDDWKGVMQPCLVNGTLFTSSNSSSSKQKVPNPTELVFHAKEWTTENIRSPSRGVNLTVPADCVVILPGAAFRLFDNDLMFSYNFECTGRKNTFPWFECSTITSNYDGQLAFLPPFINGTMSVHGIGDTMESIAIRISNEMRKVGRGPFSDAQPLVRGSAWEPRICVRIVWNWLIFPGGLLFISAVLLLVTIARNVKRKNVWKSSILPLLLKDHPGVERMGLKDLDKTAGSLEVKIQN